MFWHSTIHSHQYLLTSKAHLQPSNLCKQAFPAHEATSDMGCINNTAVRTGHLNKGCAVTNNQALRCHRQSSAVLSQTVKRCAVTDSQALCCHSQSRAVLSQTLKCCERQSSTVLSPTVKRCAVTAVCWTAHENNHSPVTGIHARFLICLEPVRFH